MCIRLESRPSSFYNLMRIAVLAASFVITVQDESVNAVVSQVFLLLLRLPKEMK